MLIGNGEVNEAEKVYSIIENAKKAPTLYETISHLKSFKEIAEKSKYNDNYDLKDVEGIIIRKISEYIDGINIANLKNGLDNVFATKPGYRPLEEILQDIGLAKEGIYLFFYNDFKKKIDEIFTEVIADTTSQELSNIYNPENTAKAANVLNLRKKIREDFNMQDVRINDLRIKKSLDYGKKILQTLVQGEDTDLDLIMKYIVTRDSAINILSHMDVVDKFKQEFNNELSVLDDKAVEKQLKNLYKFVDSVSINVNTGLFSNNGLSSYNNMINYIEQFASGKVESSKYSGLLNAINDKFKKKENDIGKELGDKQDKLYNIAFEAAQNASDKYEELRDDFRSFSTTFSEILEEDEEIFNPTLKLLDDTYRIACYNKNNPNKIQMPEN